MQRIVGLFCLISLLIVAGCSSVSRQQVVAVDSRSGSAASASKEKIEHPLPPVVSKLLQGIAQDLQAGSYRSAEKALRQAQRLSVNEPRVYLYWGQWAEQQGEWHQAEQMYRRAVSLSNANSAIQQRAMRALNKLNSTDN
jgi:uncharacterized protein HemY